VTQHTAYITEAPWGGLTHDLIVQCGTVTTKLWLNYLNEKTQLVKMCHEILPTATITSQ
jgi:hypothetical protein